MQISEYGPFLTGKETLEESDKKIVEHVLGELTIINAFNIAISHGIEYACNSTDITQKACANIGNAISSGAKTVASNVAILSEQALPETVLQGIKHAFSQLLKSPTVLKERYGIPEEYSMRALESSLWVVPILGTFKLDKIAKIKGIRNATLRLLKEDAGSVPLLPKKPSTISSQQMIKTAKKMGYEIVPGGKGSHIKMKKPDAPTLTIPGNEASLPKGTINSIWKTLGQSTKKSPLVALPLLASSAAKTSSIIPSLYSEERQRFLNATNQTSLFQDVKLEDNFLPETKIFNTPILFRSSPSTMQSEQSIVWSEVDTMAHKLADIAGNLTGVNPAITQAKELKELFVNVLTNPENAPKLLVKKLIAEPEKLFQKIITSPKEFIANSQKFMADPTLAGALGVVGMAFSVVSLANEVLPVLTVISRKGLKNPARLPLILTKEMVNMTFSKIIAVQKLAQGIIKDPFKTGKQLIKGLIQTPKVLCSNVKNLFGHDKRKAKRKARKLQKLQAAYERQALAQQEQVKQAIVQAVPPCYKTAVQQWMVNENRTSMVAYFNSLVNDWKQASTNRRYIGDFKSYIQEISVKLMQGKFSEVVHLSPSAHLKEPTPPPIVSLAVAELAGTTLNLAMEVKAIEKEIEEHKLTSQSLLKDIGDYAQTNKKLQALPPMDKTKEQLTRELSQGLNDPEKIAAVKALLSRKM